MHAWTMVLYTFNLQENGRTVLFYAVESGNVDLVQKLLEQGADLNNIVDMYGM
jgi:ankyrin repeat protein